MKKIQRLLFLLIGIMFCICVSEVDVLAEGSVKSVSYNGVEYETIQEAINVAKENLDEEDSGVITLLDSCKIQEAISIPEGMKVTLDMNNYTISSPDETLYKYGTAMVINSGDLTVKNGTFSVKESQFTSQTSSFEKTCYIIKNLENAQLNLSNVSFTEKFNVINNWPNAKTVGANVVFYSIYNAGGMNYDRGTINMNTEAKAWMEQSAFSYGIYNIGQATIKNLETNLVSHASKITTTTIARTQGKSGSTSIINDGIMTMEDCYLYDKNDTNGYSSQSYNGNIFNTAISIINNKDAILAGYNVRIESVSNTDYNSSQVILCMGIENYGELNLSKSNIKATSEFCSSSSVNCGIYNEGIVSLGENEPVDITTLSRTTTYGVSNCAGSVKDFSGEILAQTLSSSSEAYGIFNQDAGVVTLGIDDGEVALDTISIIGITAGINGFEEGTLYYYDGMFNGDPEVLDNVICPEHYEMVVKGDVISLELEKRKLVFNPNGGTSRVDSVDVPYGHYISAYLLKDLDEIPYRKHYEFSGWTMDYEGECAIVAETMLEEDVEVYAQWKPVQYSVKFMNGQTCIEQNQCEYGKGILPPSGLSQKGYDLVGWNTNVYGTGENYKVAEEIFLESNMVLYANWKLNHEHIFVWIIEKEATNTAIGKKYEKCTICDMKRNENTVIPVLPYKAGTLLVNKEYECEVEVVSSKEEPTVIYRKPIKSEKETIEIPDEIIINGISYKVINIADNAFNNNYSITKVVIGNNVKTIGERAFSGCKNLKSVTMGSRVTLIGSKAFYNCKNLAKVVIPSKVVSIGKYAFKNCVSLSTLTIEKSVEKIDKEAFSGCKKLKKIKFKAKKIKTIGKNAFKGINTKAKFTLSGTSKVKKSIKKQLTKKKIGYVKTWKIK